MVLLVVLGRFGWFRVLVTTNDYCRVKEVVKNILKEDITVLKEIAF